MNWSELGVIGYLLSPECMALQVQCVRLLCLFYGISLVITFAEKLAEAHLYAADGLMSWNILSFDRADSGALFRPGVLSQSLFGKAGTSAGHVLGIVGVGLMWWGPVRSYAFSAGMLAIVLSCVLMQLRTVYAGDGAQQMNLLIGVAILLGFNAWARPLTGVVCLLFIAAQSMLSYFVSGAAKVISPIWMRGDALRKIMGTTAFGSELGFRLASIHPQFTRMLCRVTVVVEMLFPVLVLGPKWMMILFMLWGASFHVANAVLMGLNTFVWSYLATYPALYFLWVCVHRAGW
jgi:hypothetical protein